MPRHNGLVSAQSTTRLLNILECSLGVRAPWFWKRQSLACLFIESVFYMFKFITSHPTYFPSEAYYSSTLSWLHADSNGTFRNVSLNHTHCRVKWLVDAKPLVRAFAWTWFKTWQSDERKDVKAASRFDSFFCWFISFVFFFFFLFLLFK